MSDAPATPNAPTPSNITPLRPVGRPESTALHADGDAAWDISGEVLDLIASQVRPGARTLETGAGASTLAFAQARAVHAAVTPSAEEIAAIRAEAERRGVSLANTVFHDGYSQDVLPRLSDAGRLDVALIDGGHGFPIPAVDWAYIAPRLNVGGLLIVDDVDLWTGRMLVDVTDAEPAWAREGLLRGRTAVFRLIAPFALREWTNQPAVVAKSRWPQTWRKLKNAAALALRGDLSAIRAKLANERRLAAAAARDY